MRLVNEAAQWSVLVVLIVIVLGLLRQLSLFIYGGDQGPGPRIGASLPRGLLDGGRRRQLAARIADSSYPAAAILMLDEQSMPCRRLLEELESFRGPRVAIAAIVSERSSAEYEWRVASQVDVIVKERRSSITRAGINRLPWLLWVDAELVVRHNASNERLEDRVIEWISPPGIEPDEGEQRDERMEELAMSLPDRRAE